MTAYNVYETADGRYVALGALEPKFWNRFCDAVGRREWRDRGFTPPDDPSGLYREVAELFRSRKLEEWVRIGEEADCCLTPVLTLSEAVGSALARERENFFALDQPAEGSQVMPNSGFLSARDKRTGNPVMPAPRRGEHTAEILLEMGFRREEIDRFMEEGIVEGGESR
jgi:crotonobetainyl-CoA:carnitine CoA-transferase CaiB-like acyl-CoA transferase